MNKIAKIKLHLHNNKKVYITGGVCLVVGVIGGTLLTKNAAMQSNMTRVFSPGDNNLVQIYLAPLGDPGNVVQCIETGTTYASQGELARALGTTKQNVSAHLKGTGMFDLFGKHYEVLGKAGQPLAA